MTTTTRTIAARLLALSLLAAPAAARADAPAGPPADPPHTPESDVSAAFDACPVGQPLFFCPGAARVALPIRTPILFFGEFWTDTGDMFRNNGESGKPDQTTYYMQGRLLLGAKYVQQLGSLKAEAKGEFLALVNDRATYEPHSQDVYLKVGQEAWNLQIGRFLAWEVFTRGLGMDYYTADEAGAQNGPSMYRVDLAQGRGDEPGQAAAHWYPAPGLGVELATVFGAEGSQNQLGARPTVVYSFGPVDLVAGGEILRQQPQYANDKVEVTSYGGGGRAQLRIPHLTVRPRGAPACTPTPRTSTATSTRPRPSTRSAMGGFANLDFGPHTLGVGGFFTEQKNKVGERPTHTQAFLAYQLQTPVTGLSVKAVARLRQRPRGELHGPRHRHQRHDVVPRPPGLRVQLAVRSRPSRRGRLEEYRMVILAPLSGVVVPLDAVPDPVFAGKMVGDGVAIDPTSCEVLAPFSGTITQLHQAHHALAVTADNGVEVLIHVGLDTIDLKGEGLTPLVAQGARVEAGQALLVFDAEPGGAQGAQPAHRGDRHERRPGRASWRSARWWPGAPSSCCGGPAGGRGGGQRVVGRRDGHVGHGAAAQRGRAARPARRGAGERGQEVRGPHPPGPRGRGGQRQVGGGHHGALDPAGRRPGGEGERPGRPGGGGAPGGAPRRRLRRGAGRGAAGARSRRSRWPGRPRRRAPRRGRRARWPGVPASPGLAVGRIFQHRHAAVSVRGGRRDPRGGARQARRRHPRGGACSSPC